MSRSRRLVLATLLTSALPAQYVGSDTCRTCHAARFELQSQTGHAHALARDEANHRWAFGAGAKAITYVRQVDGGTYAELGLSYYASTKSTALTPGHNDPSDALYRTFDPQATTLRCFRCHSTGPLRLDPAGAIQPFETGVRCESCHGPGGAHAKAGGAVSAIFNPKRLTAAELNEFCGSCHRPPTEGDWADPWKTRHQPSSLAQSSCFRKSAGALSCLTCHDPHSALDRKAANYDKQCASCHPTVRHRTVTAARSSCISCHMPQVTANPQLKFTNHWIGIYSPVSSLLPSRRATAGLPPAPKTKPVPAPADASTLRPLFEQALADREQQLGPQHASVARSASDFGLFLQKTGDPAAAAAPLRKALQIDQANAAAELPASQENLALLLETLGQPEEAFRLLQAAAAGPDRAVSARASAALAMLDPRHAETYYRQALQAEEAASGKDHPRVAILLNDLALAMKQGGNSAAAEPLFRRALAIQQQRLGSNHTATASTMSNLSGLLEASGQLAEAERLLRTALRVFEQRLGPESAELATSCANLGELLWTKGDRPAALPLYRRAVAIDEVVYGPDRPEVADDLTNLGLLLRESGQPASASAQLQRALSIYEIALGPNSSQAKMLREKLRD